MKGFWTCGPFKEATDRLERMVFRAEQMEVFMKLLEEDKQNQEIIASGSLDEQLIAKMIQIDIDKKMATILGVPSGNEKENDEIFGEALLKHVGEGTEE